MERTQVAGPKARVSTATVDALRRRLLFRLVVAVVASLILWLPVEGVSWIVETLFDGFNVPWPAKLLAASSVGWWYLWLTRFEGRGGQQAGN